MCTTAHAFNLSAWEAEGGRSTSLYAQGGWVYTVSSRTVRIMYRDPVSNIYLPTYLPTYFLTYLPTYISIIVFKERV